MRWNLQGAAEGRHTGDAVVGRLGGILATQGKGPGIQSGIVEDEPDSAII